MPTGGHLVPSPYPNEMKYPYLGKKDTTRLCAFAARATGYPRRQPSDSVSDCRQFLFRVPTSRQTECGCHGAPVSAINRNRNNTLTAILITESVLFNCRLLTSQNLTTSKSSSGFNFFVSPGGASLDSLRWGPISVVQDQTTQDSSTHPPHLSCWPFRIDSSASIRTTEYS